MSRFLDMFVYKTPPTTNGASTAPKTPFGQRAASTTNLSVTEIVLTGDLFLQPPDAGGNQASSDYRGPVLVELFADGDDMAILAGPKGAALTPDLTAVGASANACERIVKGERLFLMFEAGSGKHDSLYVKNATTTGTLRYRVVSSLPGAR